MEEGWVKVHRKLMGEYGYLGQVFCKNMAWIDLIMEANYAPAVIWKRGIPVNLKRGDVGRGQDELAKRWRWSRGKVIRFLNELQEKGWIVQQGNNVTTCITIVDYERYQGDGTANEQEVVTETGNKQVANQYLNKEERSKRRKKNTGASAPAPVLEVKTEEDGAYVAFIGWLQKNAPRVMQLKQTISINDYSNLKKKYGTGARKKLMQETLLAMQNRADLLKKYVSAYQTLDNWMAREIKTNPHLYPQTELNGTIATEKTSREQAGEAFLRAI